MANRAFSAARARIYIGPTLVGWAEGFQARENTASVPVKILGEMYAQVFEPVEASASGSFDVIHLLAQPLSTIPGWATQFLTTRQWVTYQSPTLTLTDSLTGKHIVTLVGIFPENRTFTLAQGSLMQENCSFVALRLREHVDPVVTPTS